MSKFRAISFDCYGTLVDWESGILAAFEKLFAGVELTLSPARLLELFATHESALEAQVPIVVYFEVLEQVAARVAKDAGVAVSAARCEQFANSVGDWPLFNDVLPMLHELPADCVLAILSNVDRRCFDQTVAKFEGCIDMVCIAEETGAYKPAAQAFEALLQQLADRGIAKSELLHVAQSLYHDHEPAQRLGISSCWVDRRHSKAGWGAVPPPAGEVQPTYRIGGLAALVPLVSGTSESSGTP